MQGLKSKKLRLTVLSGLVVVLLLAVINLPYLAQVLVGFNYSQNVRETPASVSGWKGALPYERKVTVRKSVQESQDLSCFGDALTPLASYDVDSGNIVLTAGSQQSLNHEYGHALLVDLLAQRNGGNYGKAATEAMALNVLQRADRDSSSVPTWLEPVADDYRNCSQVGALGRNHLYYFSNLNEYFAECYSLYTNGQQDEVPEDTRAFLAAVERGEF